MTPPTRSTEEAYRLIVEQVVGHADIDLAEELMADDFVARRTGLQTTFTLAGGTGPGAGGAPVPGKQTFVGGLARIKASFPDWAARIHHCAPAGNVVGGAFAVTGTFTGAPFLGIPANGAPFIFEEAGFVTFRNGQAIEGWFVGDELGLLHTLGAVNLLPGLAAPGPPGRS